MLISKILIYTGLNVVVELVVVGFFLFLLVQLDGVKAHSYCGDNVLFPLAVCDFLCAEKTSLQGRSRHQH